MRALISHSSSHMTNASRQHAIVIGAGMGGLLFASALCARFERVTILERDILADDSQPRASIPQGRHLHALLAGGCRSMERLLPGITADLRAAGGVEFVAGLSVRVERPGYDPFPLRDAGFSSLSMSRPLLEWCVRQRVRMLTNVSLEEGVAVERLLHESERIAGVALRDGRVLEADLVVDASGRGELTMRALATNGYELPQETTIGVDLRYATAVFRIPADSNVGWRGVMTVPDPRQSSSGLLMAAIEGNRWICTLGWRGDAQAPIDRDSFIEITRGLRTETCYDAIRNAPLLGRVERFAFPESRHRHFAELTRFPRGLLPVADALCRFNPVYGQGMTVAALEAEDFGLLCEHESGDDADENLARRFFQRADRIIEQPWNMSALPDLFFPDTRGVRPPGLLDMLRFGTAFTELAARDAEVHVLMLEMANLLKPRSALTDNPVLMQRIYGVMEEMARAAASQRSGL
jgi:2-polyprenyl-6-methoxyphenol hydroxylase-like FAD-dependent oxidoreductase